MIAQMTEGERVVAIQRLTALWALNECGLGGVLHALQSPFTGMVVGSIAMICIAMICFFAEQKWKAVMSSLIIVLIIKAMVSPHSSPTAYLAVTFQAVTGAFIYRFIPGILFGSILFAVLGLLESALQRLIVLTVLYGNTLWEAIDIWGEWISEKWNFNLPASSSTILIGIYLGVHFIGGLLLGWLITQTIKSIATHWGQETFRLRLSGSETKTYFMQGTRKKWKRFAFLIVLIVMILVAYSLDQEGPGITKGLVAASRAILILLLWFVFLAPLALVFLKKFLAKKHQLVSEQVSATMALIPQLTWIVHKAWKETGTLPVLRRLKKFILLVMLYSLQYQPSHDPDTDRAGT